MVVGAVEIPPGHQGILQRRQEHNIEIFSEIRIQRSHSLRRDRVLRGVCIVLLLCASLFCDWALLAPVFTLLFAWARGNRTRQKAAFGAAALLYGGMAGLGSGQVWEAVGCAVPILVSAFVILYLYNGRRAACGRTFYKWFFYAFYPAHLLVLGLLRLAV